MNIQKTCLFKDRRLILLFILNLCIKYDIDANNISIVAHTIDSISIEFYIFFLKKIKNKCLLNMPIIEVQTNNYGMCNCYIVSYEEFQKKLIYNDEYYWSIHTNSQILLDLSHKYKKMIEMANCKKNWRPLFKKIFC
jgi:hypothetical protein